MRRTYLHLGAIVLAGMLLLGCQRDEISRHRLSGTVTYHGKPVPAGAIFFEPDASQGNSGAPSYAQIKEGKFDTAAENGLGFIGGPHVVTIEAFDGKAVNDYAPFGVSLTPGKSYVKKFDLPSEDAELTIEMGDGLKK
ncbi:hypothetical protein LOC68_15605 [Blastopirellula sp. JC732]|uniref:Carboxypeptidase regulatory-like domain-containing protein n=1 Tax=Blastopirellula sediminis TaxID=2894196 RepID=A0A9X1SG46_9BACT|nr:hypothetical protein [Blastopirellula sediminis]MCC9606889.1 hypothetical protein [Blastopirellula sediminis]MCC9629815.1 hypothetical protein [Blastopirellula sediminis]